MKSIRPLAAAAALMMMMLLAGSAQAAYTVYLYESGGDVRASGSGSLNLAGAVGPAAGVSSTVALIGPFFGLLHTGAAGNVNRYTNIVGPAAFGAGGPAPADASAGDLVGIRAVLGEFFVPAGYVSGAPLSSSAVWNGTTLAALGATPGTYVWSWAGDTFTLNVGAPPPGPAAAPIPTLSGGALAALALLLGLLARASKVIRRR